VERRTPVNVVTLTDAIAISAGGFHTCALTSAGAVKCWGRNTSTQLGDGTSSNSLVPVDVLGMQTGVIAVSAGASRSCAIVEDGRARCWGATFLDTDSRNVVFDVPTWYVDADMIFSGSFDP
jgi:alpha-tubulin suppressor-like RCC1 family protein